MNTLDIIRLGWPYIGLGGSIVILLLLLFSDTFRSEGTSSKWFDPVWLSWLMVVAYLLHVCEEYGLHISNGQFDLVTNFEQMGISERFGGIPHYFFPYVNIAFTWIALPVAAVICRKNPVIGLSGIGFLVVNGLTHVGPMAAGIMPLAKNAGFWTGLLVFIPLFCWICYACAKKHLLPRKGLGIAITSGVIAHILLFSIYIFNKLLGSSFVAFYVPVVVFSPLWISWILCRIYKITLS